MGQINMPPNFVNNPPPGGDVHKKKKKITFAKYTQKFKDDPLTIAVTSDGEFVCLPLGDFSPKLPEGYVPQRVEPYGPYTPVHNNKDVVMIYVDLATSDVYVTLIEIRD